MEVAVGVNTGVEVGGNNVEIGGTGLAVGRIVGIEFGVGVEQEESRAISTM
jgi:hypothetical protein